MQIGVAEFLEKVAKLKKVDERVNALKANDSFVLRTVLQGAFDPRVKWALPEGNPPYKPNDLTDQESVFIRDCRKLVYFVEGGMPGLSQVKREQLFVELLENVTPADARMILALKDKKLPWKGITADVVRQAFPDLLPEETKA